MLRPLCFSFYLKCLFTTSPPLSLYSSYLFNNPILIARFKKVTPPRYSKTSYFLKLFFYYSFCHNSHKHVIYCLMDYITAYLHYNETIEKQDFVCLFFLLMYKYITNKSTWYIIDVRITYLIIHCLIHNWINKKIKKWASPQLLLWPWMWFKIRLNMF